ncbi:ion channel [Natrinema zhouii]|uniref:NAD-binding protein n=1 Tax=Natrinema zhouii TaxID=1710539 RepID=A0A7D6CQ13_9EURY|nr:ion channel [Natrinema zhouii]QLK27137.1 ion channel [Natrinema zhouii]
MFEAFHSRRPGGRVAVWIVAAIALTSIATGVGAILTRPALETGGTLGDLQAVAEFSGTIVGFALLVTAWGMRRGYRLAYVTAVLLIVLSGAHGIVQFRAVSVPLVVLSVGGLVVLVATSGRFTRSSTPDATQIGALLSIVGVLCYGTAGAYALRTGFDGVTTVVDAVYFTAVTASTVGYGDVHASTEAARLFAISLVVLGPATLAATAGSLFGPAFETHLPRTDREATAHLGSDAAVAGGNPETGTEIVILGDDETTAPIVDALASRASVAVVTSEERARRSDGVDVITGDPTADGTLERAGLETCDAVLVGTGALRDADAVIASARSRTNARIVALTGGGENESTERTEADVVVDPETVLIEATVDALLGTDGVAGQSSASAASHSG